MTQNSFTNADVRYSDPHQRRPGHPLYNPVQDAETSIETLLDEFGVPAHLRDDAQILRLVLSYALATRLAKEIADAIEEAIS